MFSVWLKRYLRSGCCFVSLVSSSKLINLINSDLVPGKEFLILRQKLLSLSIYLRSARTIIFRNKTFKYHRAFSWYFSSPVLWVCRGNPSRIFFSKTFHFFGESLVRISNLKLFKTRDLNLQSSLLLWVLGPKLCVR
jgi:hypothetical protein